MSGQDDSLTLDLQSEQKEVVESAADRIELSPAMSDVLHGFLQFLRLAKNAAAHTVRAYRADLEQFLGFVETHPDLGKGGLYRVERIHARAFLVGLQQNDYSRASLARKLASLRAFCRWAKKQAYIENDPTIGV